MSIFSDNIRFLRHQVTASQQAVADELNLTRGRYGKYEDGANEPPLEVLVKISKYFRVSVDLLLTVDIRKYPLDKILALPDNRIVLPISVDARGDNKIEIIPHKASMGYLSGFSDPEYIESLQTISLPFLRNGTYRAFPVEGDSMPPYNEGTYIVGKYVESIDHLKKNKTYIFITKDGITYKRLQKVEPKSIVVASDNKFYQPYSLKQQDIIEIWSYALSLNSDELKPPKAEEISNSQLYLKLREEIEELKGLINKS